MKKKKKFFFLLPPLNINKKSFKVNCDFLSNNFNFFLAITSLFITILTLFIRIASLFLAVASLHGKSEKKIGSFLSCNSAFFRTARKKDRTETRAIKI